MAGLFQWFWSEWFWLPVGTTWEDLKNDSTEIYKPQLEDIFYSSVATAILLLGIRFIVERYFLYPVGLRVGVILKKCHPVEKNDLFEKVYKKEPNPDKEMLEDLMKKTSLKEREIQRWFRRRRNKDVQGPMKKFCECGWLSIYYTTMLAYGLYFLWEEPWFWSTRELFKKYPFQHVPTGLYYYYAIEMGFYMSLLTSLLFDTKRKDFNNMAIHHMLTLSLMLFSWSTNRVYIGCLVLFLHDIADSWIGVAKMMKYCNKMTLCEVLFGIFVVVWIITRCFVYPYWLLYTIAHETYYFELSVGYHHSVFNSASLFVLLLSTLQLLHWLWTYMILGIAIQKVWYGELKQDVRSESEAELSSGDEIAKNGNAMNQQANNNNATVKQGQIQTVPNEINETTSGQASHE